MKTNFFRALFGSCSGTAVFEQLRYQHGGRAFCHLVFMSILCSILIMIGIYHELQPKITGSLNIIAENCGSVRCSEQSVVPEKSPDKSKNFVIAGPTAVVYAPSAADLPEDFQQGCPNGILWIPTKIAFWQKNSDNTYKFTAWDFSGRDNLSAAELKDCFVKTPDMQLAGNHVINKTEMLAFSKFFMIMTMIILAIVNFLQIVLYIAMFAGVFALMNMGRPRYIKTWEMVKLAIYAGFPPMLIGSVATALRLPFLDFHMTYVLGMTFYLMYIMNRLDRNRQMRTERDEGC